MEKNIVARRAEKKRFKILTEDEIKNAYKYQTQNMVWTFYQEREFMETLFQNRFNYLLIIYSLFVNGFFIVNDYKNKLIILCIGGLVTALMCIIIYRAYVKLIIILRILYSLDDEHVFPVIDKEIKGMKLSSGFPVNHIIGIVIPNIMVFSFLVGIIAMVTKKWSP